MGAGASLVSSRLVISYDIGTLIAESEALELLMAEWQTSGADHTELNEVRQRYRAFFAQSKQVLTDEQCERFQKQHDGSFGNTDISDYLADPLGRSPYFDTPELKDSDLAWKVGFKTHIASKLAAQRDILEEARFSTTNPEQLLSTWAAIFRRLPEFLRAWSKSSHTEQVPPLALTGEKGLQDVINAILRLHFEDVRPEDAVPQRSGAASFVDLFLPEIGLVVEVKMTRATLKDKKIGEELLVDAGRYPAHIGCLAILAVVYDPDHFVSNPKGLEADLSVPTAAGMPMRTVIVS